MAEPLLRIHDTLSGGLQPVTPADGKQVRLYCCGPTVYGPAHIGNFRTFVVQDCFRRVVEGSGAPVRHVRNVTDVDDKTIRESIRSGTPLGAFTAGWLRRFQEDAAALGCLPPHVEPGAVAHIADQIALIESLFERGVAYTAPDGSVYFSVERFPAYGRLSRLDRRQLRPGAAAANQADEYDKESIADFALWKARKPEDGDNYWESPWGPGRPGWHLECSAMSRKYLGEGFDVHSGGIDLCFPHHENEIAQSEAASGTTFARLWFHIAHLLVDGGKMSKSLGNLYTLDDIRARGFTPRELRYVLLSGHYRQPLNFSFDSLHAARQALHKLDRFAALTGVITLPESPRLPGSDEAFGEVTTALCNDLNTPAALGRLFGSLKELEKNWEQSDEPARRAAAARFAAVLAIFGFPVEPLDNAAASPSDAPEEIRQLAEQRWKAKQDRDFATADRLRNKIADAGWTVKDNKDGYDVLPAANA